MANSTSKNGADEIKLAYSILKQIGQPLYYRDLIDKIIAEKGGTVRPPAHIIAEIHTQINLDSRFIHTGKSMWGLAEWSPQRSSAKDSEETGAIRQENVRREKLLAAIQQDFDHEENAGEEPADLLEAGSDTEEDEEEDSEA